MTHIERLRLLIGKMTDFDDEEIELVLWAADEIERLQKHIIESGSDYWSGDPRRISEVVKH